MEQNRKQVYQPAAHLTCIRPPSTSGRTRTYGILVCKTRPIAAMVTDAFRGCLKSPRRLVPEKRFELSRLSALVPKTSVYTFPPLRLVVVSLTLSQLTCQAVYFPNSTYSTGGLSNLNDGARIIVPWLCVPCKPIF